MTVALHHHSTADLPVGRGTGKIPTWDDLPTPAAASDPLVYYVMSGTPDPASRVYSTFTDAATAACADPAVLAAARFTIMYGATPGTGWWSWDWSGLDATLIGQLTIMPYGNQTYDQLSIPFDPPTPPGSILDDITFASVYMLLLGGLAPGGGGGMLGILVTDCYRCSVSPTGIAPTLGLGGIWSQMEGGNFNIHAAEIQIAPSTGGLVTLTDCTIEITTPITANNVVLDNCNISMWPPSGADVLAVASVDWVHNTRISPATGQTIGPVVPTAFTPGWWTGVEYYGPDYVGLPSGTIYTDGAGFRVVKP